MNNKDYLDLSKEKFGRLTVIKIIGFGNQGLTYWRCKCDCRQEIIATNTQLISGSIRSCRGWKCESITADNKPLDLTNRVFGELFILGLVDIGRLRPSGPWLCACSCGRQITASTNQLLSGDIRHCKEFPHKISNSTED